MDYTPTNLAIIVVVGIGAAFINVLAGGGSLIAIPTLIFMGLPDTVANGTIRVAVLVQTLAAVLRYRSEQRTDFALTRSFALPTLAGAIAGAWLAVQVTDDSFRSVLVAALLGTSGLLLLQPLIPLLQTPESGGAARPRWMVTLLMIGVGLYGGFLQAGVGFVLLAVLAMGAGLSLVEANIQKVSLVLFYAPLTLAMFLYHGKVDLVAGAALASGQFVGAWFAAGLVLRRGETLIRVLVSVMLLAFVARLAFENSFM